MSQKQARRDRRGALMRMEWMNHARASDVFGDLYRDAVPQRSASIVVLAGGRRLCVAYLDASKRPDVADLARVHRVENMAGSFDHRWHFVAGLELAILTVRTTRPARAKFVLVWRIPDSRQFLTALAESGKLVLTTRDPAADLEAAIDGGLLFDIDVEELKLALTASALVAGLFGGAA